ncbi:hypothetical protein FRC17_008963 [Serendipita sp. 399]|nr:hypothetical protein FRC17_008963 [Serendipita sp. 399]
MSILMPPMHSLSQFDPFHSQAYSTAALFEAQEHYFQPAVYSPIGYATMHPFPVDPRWFNTSLSGHASAAPLPFSAITTPDNIIPPHTPTDVLSLSPSSTIAPIPLSGSRDRSRSMSNRIRSLTNTSTSTSNNNTTHATRLSRQSTGPSQRITRRATVSSPSVAAQHVQTPSALHSPTALPPPPPYMQSPTLHSPEDSHETRATKRRRTNDHDSSHLHTFTVVPEPPLLLTQTQAPHLSQIHPHHHHAGYAPMQTWAGPPSADPVSHGVGTQHGFAQWPLVPMSYFTSDGHDHHSIRDDTTPLTASDAHLIHFASPPTATVTGPILYPSPSPDVETPLSVIPSQAFRKAEPESPQLPQHLPTELVEPFEHGPTEFPPRPYAGGPAAISPWTYVKPVGKIYGSRLEQMPAIEARLTKLEEQVDQYLDLRATHALRNSQLPGLDFATPLMEFGSRAPCRMFGGRIWPTALARRVRRTPRD